MSTLKKLIRCKYMNIKDLLDSNGSLTSAEFEKQDKLDCRVLNPEEYSQTLLNRGLWGPKVTAVA